MHRSCAAAVWPTAQMSSRSPSTVSSMVRRIAAGSTFCALYCSVAARQRVLLEHQPHRLEIEFRGQVEHGEILVVEILRDLRLLDLAFDQCVVELADAP